MKKTLLIGIILWISVFALQAQSRLVVWCHGVPTYYNVSDVDSIVFENSGVPQMQLPTVTTSSVTNIASSTATCGGNVTSDGGATVTARGVCWSTSQNPTISDSHTTNGSGMGNFISSITGLTPNTTYYVRAYAINSVGTAYGTQRTFTTSCNTVTVNISGTTTIDYGQNTMLTASGANSYRWSNNATTPAITVSPASTTTYTVTGTDSYGCTGTASVTVTVNAIVPTVTTKNVSDIASTSATCGGNVTSDGGSAIVERGVCWSTSHNPTVNNSHTIDGAGTGTFTSTLTGLAASTTYYVRAYVVNSVGIGYGGEVSFTTLTDPCQGVTTVTDYDGNVYNTIGVGNQCWMKENLRTTKYSDGTPISQGSGISYDVGYWYYPNDSSSNMSTYGLLYNWKAMMRNSSSSSANPSRVQGICPTGWHVPSGSEWGQLTDFVSSQSQYLCSGNSENIAKALASTTDWNSSTSNCAVGNDQSANNATGFGALPTGGYQGGGYVNSGGSTTFWTATESSSRKAYTLYLYCHYATVSFYNSEKSPGYSVRCLRD